MRARAWPRTLLPLAAMLLLLTSTQAAAAPAAEVSSAPAPAVETSAAPSPPAARTPLPPPPTDDLAEAEAALLEADGDGPSSLAGAVPADVAALIGESPEQADEEGGKQPVKELPPVGERQGGPMPRALMNCGEALERWLLCCYRDKRFACSACLLPLQATWCLSCAHRGAPSCRR